MGDRITLTAPVTIADETLPSGTTVEVDAQHAARLIARGRAVAAQAAPMTRAEFASGRATPAQVADAAGD